MDNRIKRYKGMIKGLGGLMALSPPKTKPWIAGQITWELSEVAYTLKGRQCVYDVLYPIVMEALASFDLDDGMLRATTRQTVN